MMLCRQLQMRMLLVNPVKSQRGCQGVNNDSPDSRGGRAGPNRPMQHSIAHGRTQGNI